MELVAGTLLGIAFGFVIGFGKRPPPARLVRMRFSIRDYYTHRRLFDDDVVLDTRAIARPAAYQVERGEGTTRWLIDVYLTPGE